MFSARVSLPKGMTSCGEKIPLVVSRSRGSRSSALGICTQNDWMELKRYMVPSIDTPRLSTRIQCSRGPRAAKMPMDPSPKRRMRANSTLPKNKDTAAHTAAPSPRPQYQSVLRSRCSCVCTCQDMVWPSGSLMPLLYAKQKEARGLLGYRNSFFVWLGGDARQGFFFEL